MKTSKLNFTFITVLILLVILLTGFGWNGWIKNASRVKDTPSIEIKPAAELESRELRSAELKSLNGTAEFYFKPAGDTRLWHVTNIYAQADSDEGRTLNNSTYTFTADSVTVVNEIASVPEWEPYISGLIFK